LTEMIEDAHFTSSDRPPIRDSDSLSCFRE
jgi:hypothetical protein